MEKSKRGRPRKEDTLTVIDRVREYRQRQRTEGTRLDGYIQSSASWRLTALAESWKCSKAAAIERLLMEADERYRDILLPETE
jgi:hypothetical protein